MIKLPTQFLTRLFKSRSLGSSNNNDANNNNTSNNIKDGVNNIGSNSNDANNDGINNNNTNSNDDNNVSSNNNNNNNDDAYFDERLVWAGRALRDAKDAFEKAKKEYCDALKFNDAHKKIEKPGIYNIDVTEYDYISDFVSNDLSLASHKLFEATNELESAKELMDESCKNKRKYEGTTRKAYAKNEKDIEELMNITADAGIDEKYISLLKETFNLKRFMNDTDNRNIIFSHNWRFINDVSITDYFYDISDEVITIHVNEREIERNNEYVYKCFILGIFAKLVGKKL